MNVQKAFDKTVDLIQDRLSLNSLNQKVISGNLANMNTPGYAAKELSFEHTLREALEDGVLSMVRSNGKHVDDTGLRASMQSPEITPVGPVDLDREMVNLARNSVEYQYMVTMLNKKFAMFKLAINEGGQ